MYFILIVFCVAQFDDQGVENTSLNMLYHLHASFPTLILLLSSTISKLSGISIDWQPNKAYTTPIILFFDWVCVSAPNKGTNSRKRKPPAGRLQQTHRKPLCLDLRPWQMLPWQKMAKPLEGRAMVAHVGCCVFCVFCVLCCV